MEILSNIFFVKIYSSWIIFQNSPNSSSLLIYEVSSKNDLVKLIILLDTRALKNGTSSYKSLTSFIPYLEKMSTIKYYSKTNIGSRPSKRGVKGEAFNFDKLRAIPFVGREDYSNQHYHQRL